METGTFYSIFAWSVMLASSVAVGGCDRELMTPEEEKVLAEHFPDEAKSLKILAEKSGLTEAVAEGILGIEQISKKKLAIRGNVSPKDAEAFQAIWKLAIKFVKNSGDEKKGCKILSVWDENFASNNHRQAFVQLSALGEVWGKQMVTKAVWNYFENPMKKFRPLESLGYALYKSGDKEALQKLEEIQGRMKDAEGKSIIQKVLNWSKFKKEGGSPGPAEPPPAKPILTNINEIGEN